MYQKQAMIQELLSHGTLSIQKERTVKLDLIDFSNMFYGKNDKRQRFFGVFC